MMLLSRLEKEKLVLEYYEQGKTIKEIAKELRMSFRDIGAVLRKASGEKEENEQDKKEPLSSSTLAYRLFMKGKMPTEVAIALNLSALQVTKFYEEYLSLSQMQELRNIYEEIGGGLTHFLKLYKLSKGAQMKPQHVIKALRAANNDLPRIERKYLGLLKEIDLIEAEKHRSRRLGDQIRLLAKVSIGYKEDIKRLKQEKIRLETLVREFNNDDSYKKIRHIAEEQVKYTLSNSNTLLRIAIASLLESIRDNPDRYIMLAAASPLLNKN
jgi:hypothetical protein